MSKLTLTLITAILMMVSAHALMMPGTMNYQGRLTDPGGSPVADSTYDVTFTIYDSTFMPTAIPVWAETLSVTTQDGLFSAILGQTNPINANMLSAIMDTAYLGIQVGSDPELFPKTPLTTVPMAVWSEIAEIAWTVGPNSIDSTELRPGGISFSDIGQNGAGSGQVMKWNGSAWVADTDATGGGAAAPTLSM